MDFQNGTPVLGLCLVKLAGTLYIGFTSDLKLRVWRHETGAFRGPLKEVLVHPFGISREFDNVFRAIQVGKTSEGLERSKKVALIERQNP